MSTRLSPVFSTAYKLWAVALIAVFLLIARSSLGSIWIALAVTVLATGLTRLQFRVLTSTSVTIERDGTVWVDQFGKKFSLGPLSTLQFVEKGRTFPNAPTYRGPNGRATRIFALAAFGFFDKSTFEQFEELHAAARQSGGHAQSGTRDN